MIRKQRYFATYLFRVLLSAFFNGGLVNIVQFSLNQHHFIESLSWTYNLTEKDQTIYRNSYGENLSKKIWREYFVYIYIYITYTINLNTLSFCTFKESHEHLVICCPCSSDCVVRLKPLKWKESLFIVDNYLLKQNNYLLCEN